MMGSITQIIGNVNMLRLDIAIISCYNEKKEKMGVKQWLVF